MMSASSETVLPSGHLSNQEKITDDVTPSGASVIEVTVPDTVSDGGATPPTGPSPHAEESTGDLEKDINSMFKYNVEKGHCLPDESVSFSSFKFDGSNTSVHSGGVDNFKADEDGERIMDQGAQSEEMSDVSASASQVCVAEDPLGWDNQWDPSIASEKSFTSVSDADSSVIAQRVVNHVLSKAVLLTQQDSPKGLATPSDFEDGEVTPTGFQEGKITPSESLDSYKGLADSDVENNGFEPSGAEEEKNGQFQTYDPVASVVRDTGSPPVDRVAEPEIDYEWKETEVVDSPAENESDKAGDVHLDIATEVEKYVHHDVMPNIQPNQNDRDSATGESIGITREATVDGDDPKEHTHAHEFRILTTEVSARGPIPGEGPREGMIISDDGEEDSHCPVMGSEAQGPYQPVMENGKFRIVKTSPDGGSASSAIIGADANMSLSPECPESEISSSKQHEPSVDDVDEGEGPGSIDGGVNTPTPHQHSEEKVFDADGSIIESQVSLGQVTDPLAWAADERETSQDNDVARSFREKDISTSESSPKPTEQTSPPLQAVKDDLRSRYAIVDGNRYEEERTTEGGLSARDEVKADSTVDPQPVDTQDSYSSQYGIRLTRSTDTQRTEGPSRYSISPGRVSSDRHSSAYEAELIQSAYDRVAQHNLRHANDSRGSERTGSSLNTSSSLDSGHIPGFKTLQEQQASWSNMFRSLEEQHKTELRAQYQRHQQNIQRLQDQMETELRQQHRSIRNKLDIHKEALRRISPERDRVSPDRAHRSPDRIEMSVARGERSPVPGKRSPYVSPNRRQRSAERGHGDTLDDLQLPEESKTWREIYHEVRAEEEKRDPTPPPPIRRALEGDFKYSDAHMTPEMSRSERSPHSKEKQVSLEEPVPQSSYNIDRESRSRSKRSPRRPVQSPRQPAQHSSDTGLLNSELNKSQDLVSPYVKELLDNLNEGRSSLPQLTQGLESPTSGRESTGQRNVRPRAGVYSSPMPILRGKGTKVPSNTSGDRSKLETSLDTSGPLTSPSASERQRHSIDHREADRRHSGYANEDRNFDNSRESWRNDDTHLSSSTRMNLREKHAKHLNDLRAYYEEELRELRKALSTSLESSGMMPSDTAVQVGMQNQLLEAEHRHLAEKCHALEDELEEIYGRVRELEQKERGLEKRASEYSAAFADAQAIGIQHKAHIEELQRYCRDRDSFVTELESKLRTQEDTCKIYKKNLEEEMEHHRRDKNALQKVVDKYESLEREHNILKETLSATENKLFEARTEMLDLNRTISKLELENKRIGRENDNLRHKVTQSLNLSSVHESFGSPQSPRATTEQIVTVPGRESASVLLPQQNEGTSMSASVPDTRTISTGMTPVPFSNNILARIPKQLSQEQLQQTQVSKLDRQQAEPETQRRPRSRPVEREPSLERRLREGTPPRPPPSSSPPESEPSSEFSPIIKAERELYKLRDMMRQAVAIKPVENLQEPVLQKKYYGSERPSQQEEYVIDLSVPRGRKEKPSSHSSVSKTKSTRPNSKSDRAEKSSQAKSEKGDKSSIAKTDKGDKSSRKSGSGRSDKNSKQREDRTRRDRTPSHKDKEKTNISLQPEEMNSPTRFDININAAEHKPSAAENKPVKSSKSKDLFLSESSEQHKESRNAEEASQSRSHGNQVENTLDKLRAGDYLSRPQWEDVYTSMAKPKQDSQQLQTLTKEDKIKERMKTLSEMEHRYDDLHIEKRQLESSISKIPMHGRVDRHKRQHKEELEERLDKVDKELGSLRMSLKRCNILKTAG